VRYLHVRLTGDEVELHPLVSTLTDRDLFRETAMVDWAPSYDPRRSTVLLYLDGDLAAYEAVLEDLDLVLEYDVTRIDAGRGYAYVHSKPHPTEWLLYEAFDRERLLVVSPIGYNRDGSIDVRIVGPAPALQVIVEEIPDGVETSIERVGEYALGRRAIPGPLSPKQREALAVATDLGYYEVPKEATRDEVAERLDCAPSTASEHLRKAEARLVRTYLERAG
jgi:hypothetical protein